LGPSVGTIKLRKNHPASLRLQCARYYNAHRLIEPFSAPFDDDHRSVVEITDPLVMPFAGLDHANLKSFPRQELWPQGASDQIQIDDWHVMKLRNFVEIEISRD
jgi:hypothetical protein